MKAPQVHCLSNSFQVDDEGGFIKFFKSLPDNGDDTVRIFDRGDFYTAHGDNASFIARTVNAPFCLKRDVTNKPHRSIKRLPFYDNWASMTQPVSPQLQCPQQSSGTFFEKLSSVLARESRSGRTQAE
jgi:hypothetical protein